MRGAFMSLLADMPMFVGLANARHFGRAAAALGIPASTLSRRMVALEKELGVSLVNRSTRSFALTEAGQTLYERARKLIVEVNQIGEDLGQDASTVSGHIRIGLRLELAQILFVPVLREFARANPGVSIDVIAIEEQPGPAEAIDISFVVAHQISLRDSSQTARRIGRFPRMLFASKQYLKNSPSLAEPRDLENHSCLRFSRGTVQKEWELHHGKEKRRVNVKGRFSATSIALLAQCAREHLGIAMLAPFLASHPSYGAGLVRVLPEWEAAPGHIFALTANQVMPAKVATLLEVVKSGISQRLEQLERAQHST
jgi:DNA-binding transcriptional LysR family regulator